MKKLFLTLISLLFLIILSSCHNDNSIKYNTKEVDSIDDFYSLGIVLDDLNDNNLNNIKYYIINNQIAEIHFMNGDNEYIYRISKELDKEDILSTSSDHILTINYDVNDIVYKYCLYNEGLSLLWQQQETVYYLFAEGLNNDERYEFLRIACLLTDNIFVEKEVILPTISDNTTSDYIVKWFKDNNFKDIDYIYEKSKNVKEGYVISLSKNGKAYPSDEIICKISLGSNEVETIDLTNNLINYDESEFINTLKQLNLSVIKDDSIYYSNIVSKGHVLSYDDGVFPNNYIIKYRLSNGPYIFNENDFNNLNKNEVELLVDKLNKQNANIMFNFKENKTDDYIPGIIYDCNNKQDGFNNNITCKLATSINVESVNVKDYVDSYDNPCGAKDSCCLNQINYIIVKNENSVYPAGYIYEQSQKGNVKPGTIIELSMSSFMPYLYDLKSNYYSTFESSPAETKEALSKDTALGKFVNVDYEFYCDLSKKDGQILDISIFDDNTNMWNSNYKQGNYSKYTKIKCVINDLSILKNIDK